MLKDYIQKTLKIPLEILQNDLSVNKFTLVQTSSLYQNVSKMRTIQNTHL